MSLSWSECLMTTKLKFFYNIDHELVIRCSHQFQDGRDKLFPLTEAQCRSTPSKPKRNPLVSVKNVGGNVSTNDENMLYLILN